MWMKAPFWVVNGVGLIAAGTHGWCLDFEPMNRCKGDCFRCFFFLMREGVNMYLWLSWKSLWTPGWPWIERDPPVPPCLVSMHFWRYRKPRGSAVSQAAWAVLSEQTDQVRQSPRFNIRTSRQGKRNAWTDFVFSSKRKKGKQHLTIKWRVFFMSCISYCTEKKNLPKRNKKKLNSESGYMAQWSRACLACGMPLFWFLALQINE